MTAEERKAIIDSWGVATNEEEAKAMMARAIETFGGEIEISEADAPQPMTDEQAGEVSGGYWENTARVGDKCTINGGLYQNSYAELYSGKIEGKYYIQRYIYDRPAPYLLKQNVGWVKATSVMENWKGDGPVER